MDEDPGVDLHQWCRDVLEEGRGLRRHHEAQWWENIATYAGDLWVEYNVHDRRLIEQKKPAHRVRLPINLAQPVVRTEYAKLVKNRPIIECIAASDDQRALNAAEVGDKMINQYAEREFALGRLRRRVLQWVLITGFGGVFSDFDPTARGKQEVLVGPDGQPITDPRMIAAVQRYYRDKKKAPKTMPLDMGEFKPVALSPFQLLYDYSKIFFEEAAWCIVSDVYDVDEVYRRWGVEVEADKGAHPGVIEKRLLARLDLTNKLTLKSPDAQRLCEIHRMFIKPGHRYFKDGAEIVFNKDEILKSTTFPFEHGELPVSTMGHIPFPITQFPLSVLSQVRGPVLELSRTTSQLIENRNLMANPPWRIPEQIRLKTEIHNKPGLQLKYTHMPNVPGPEPVQMPEIPQYVKDLIPILKENILEISGQGETSQGRVPPGARSGVAIAYLQEEDDTRLGPTVQEFEEMNERFSWQMLKVFAEKYDLPRTIRLYRKHSDPEVFDFIGSMVEDVAGVEVQAGSALPRSKAAKQQFILDLWDRKLEQDPRKVREMLELSEGGPDEWEVDIRQAERENRRIMEGQQAEVKEWYNHPAHHYKHREFMKSPDFEALPPETQTLFEQHDAMHTSWETKQQADQLKWQAMGAEQNGGGEGGANGITATPEEPFNGTGDFAAATGGEEPSVQDYEPQ